MPHVAVPSDCRRRNCRRCFHGSLRWYRACSVASARPFASSARRRLYYCGPRGRSRGRPTGARGRAIRPAEFVVRVRSSGSIARANPNSSPRALVVRAVCAARLRWLARRSAAGRCLRPRPAGSTSCPPRSASIVEARENRHWSLTHASVFAAFGGTKSLLALPRRTSPTRIAVSTRSPAAGPTTPAVKPRGR